MRSLCFIVILLLGSVVTANAQKADDGSRELDNYCGTVPAMEEFLNQNPEQKERAAKAREKLEQWTDAYEQTVDAKGGDEEYIVPVVFHVVHNNGAENISVEQVQDGLDILNEDFNAQNSDLEDVVPEFTDITGDVGITFRLARYDPEGNCTNGIVRTESSLTYEGSNDLKEISPSWDRSSYLNVWVCANIEGNVAGYSQYPSSVDGPWGEDIDGIVILHDYVGSIGTGSYYRARTLTHEVGHWINLAHPWGSSNQPEVPENCDIDDEVDDTPLTVGSTQCYLTNSSCGSLDNVQNFMEYANCDKMFTVGQKNRMLAALTSDVAERSSLWTMENLQETGVLEEPQLCQAEFMTSTRMICAGDSIQFTDGSYSNVSSWNWSFEGGAPATSDEQNPEVSFPSAGTYSVTLTAGDGVNTVSETKQGFITVLPEEGEPIPFSEDFEALNELPGGFWFLDEDNNAVSWKVMQNVGLSGSRSIGIENYSKNAGEVERVMSNVVSVPEGSEVLYISYEVAYRQKFDQNQDKLRLFASPDCGELWSLRDQKTGDNLATGEPQFGYYEPELEEDWQTVVVDNTPDFFFSDQFRIMFEFTSDGGNNVFIDNVNIALEDVSGTSEVKIVDLGLFPNPAEEQANLTFALDRSGTADIAVYDLAGRRVMTISRGEMAAGVHRISVNTGDLGKGMYTIQLRGEALRGSRKLVVH